MKINKGYSLSQFVDYLFADDGECKPQIKDSYIRDYNDLLKQPLTKEMFVNECTLPDEPILCKLVLALDEWREKEKRVIFEGTLLLQEESIGLCKVFVNDIKIAHYWKSDGSWLCLYKTLNDLFEATNGQLKLKNVTI